MPPSPPIALVLAGGTGTRLWPLSRRGRPKQLLPLVAERSMVAETVARLAPLVPADRVLVLTNRQYVEAMAAALPEVPTQNIVGEPAALGTAPAIALGTALASALDPEAVLVVLSADHHISPPEAFRETLALAVDVARSGRLVTIGIPPAYAETAFGYIELGDPIEVAGLSSTASTAAQARGGGVSAGDRAAPSPAAFEVASFREKPDRVQADAYVQSGRALWNAGIFVWQAATIRAAFHAHLPQLAHQLDAMAAAARRHGLGSAELEAAVADIWPAVTDRTTVDYGIMERASNVAVVRASFAWSDIGSWDALGEALGRHKDAEGNVALGPHLLHGTSDTLVFSYGERMVAAMGVSGLVVVDTGDVVLVCPRDRVQEVRALVDALMAQGREDLC